MTRSPRRSSPWSACSASILSSQAARATRHAPPGLLPRRRVARPSALRATYRSRRRARRWTTHRARAQHTYARAHVSSRTHAPAKPSRPLCWSPSPLTPFFPPSPPPAGAPHTQARLAAASLAHAPSGGRALLRVGFHRGHPRPAGDRGLPTTAPTLLPPRGRACHRRAVPRGRREGLARQQCGRQGC